MGTGAVCALFTARPTSDRQAATWGRVQDYLQHKEEREALRRDGIGADTVAAQRRVQGSRYLSVRDWGELDGFRFRCRITRPLAEILLSLFAFKRVRSFRGSYTRIARMLGAFGYPCSPGSVRNALAELRALGLQALPMCETHPEGFRCRPDRIGSELRQTCENPEAAPLYVLSGTLALMVGALAVRCAAGAARAKRKNSASISRVPTIGNLPRAFASAKQKNSSRNLRATSHRSPTPSATADSIKDRPTAGSSKTSQRRLNGAQKGLNRKERAKPRRCPNVAPKASQGLAGRRSLNPSTRRPTPLLIDSGSSHEVHDHALQTRRAKALRELLSGDISPEEFSTRAALPVLPVAPPPPLRTSTEALNSSPERRSGLSELNGLVSRITQATESLLGPRRALIRAAVDKVLELLRAGEIPFTQALRLLRVHEATISAPQS